MFVSKYVVFLMKEFLLRDKGSKVELEEVQDTQENTNQLPKPEANIHRDEIEVNPFEAIALRRSSRIRTIPERYVYRMTFCS